MFIPKSAPLALRLAATCLFMICLIVVSSWTLDRFWLYHAQNQVLRPDDYTVSVVPAAQAPNADFQRSDTGAFAVRVVTRGTSHVMDRITQSLALPFAMSLGGLIATVYFARAKADAKDAV